MELRDYVKLIRARWWLIVLSMLIMLAFFLALVLFQPPLYQGEAQVIVSQQNTGALLLGAPRTTVAQISQSDVQTQADVISSRRIAEQVIQTLRLRTTTDSLLKHVTATTDGETNIVTVDVTDRSPVLAAQIANAFAAAYVSWSLESRQASIKAAADDVQNRLAAAQQQIVALTPANGAPLKSDKAVKLEAATTLYASLAANLEQLRINEQLETGFGSVLTSAVPNPSPVSPKPVRDGTLALVIGLGLGLGAVFVAEQLDTRIRSSAEAGELFGAPVLATIPTETQKGEDLSLAAIIRHPEGAAAEAYRALRSSIDFINFEHSIKTILITSPGPSEGKSTVAANLAAALSQVGKKVVLINCDFHRPSTATFFGLKNQIGLSDVLTGAHELGEALQQPKGLDRLRVVSAGRVPPNPGGLLGSSSMERLLAGVREQVDWIILDTPPVLAVADAATLARLVDGVLIVARIGFATREAARNTRDQLENAGGRNLGVVAWGHAPGSGTVSYAGYYKYGSHDSSGH